MNWRDKYELALQEEMTIKDIMMLRDCGHPRASEIRNNCIKYALQNGICIKGRYIPTELIFQVTGRDLDFYYQKMLQERQIKHQGE